MASPETGNTDLMAAVERGSMSTVRFLLEQPDILVNARNKQGLSAIHIATQDYKPDMVDLLVKSGADINQR